MSIGTKAIEHYIEAIKSNQGLYTKYPIQTTANMAVGGNLTVTGTLSAGSETTTSQVITAASANAFAVGANGTTNPAFNVDTSASTVATGLNVAGAAAGSGVTLSVLSSGTNENLAIQTKGSGTLTINNGNGGGNFSVFGGNVGIDSTSSNALVVGPTDVTNPVFQVDASTASVATGISIKGAAAAAGVSISAISSGASENLTVSAKGSTGTITLNPAIVAAAGGKAQSGIMFGSIAVGLFTGTGAPSFSAMNGSIYVDSNATTTTTRIYVNKSGAGTAGTTWTNLTTAA